MKETELCRINEISARLVAITSFSFALIDMDVKFEGNTSSITDGVESTQSEVLPVTERVHHIPEVQHQLENATLKTKSTILLERQYLPDFSEAKSWDDMSEHYKDHIRTFGQNKKVIRGKKREEKTKEKVNPVLMTIPFNWQYGENFSFSRDKHSITFYRSPNDEFQYNFDFRSSYTNGSHVGSHGYDCDILMSSSPADLPLSNIHRITRNTERLQRDVCYDRIAILSTRGYANMYHNAEWIVNFIHYANNIAQFPLVILRHTV